MFSDLEAGDTEPGCIWTSEADTSLEGPGPRVGWGDREPNTPKLLLLRIPFHPLPMWGLFPRASSSSLLTPAHLKVKYT